MDAFADLVILVAAVFLSFFATLWLARVALGGIFHAMPVQARTTAPRTR